MVKIWLGANLNIGQSIHLNHLKIFYKHSLVLALDTKLLFSLISASFFIYMGLSVFNM